MCPRLWVTGSRTQSSHLGNYIHHQLHVQFLILHRRHFKTFHDSTLTHVPRAHAVRRSANCLMYFIALILTEIVTNNAAAAITIPIALSAAKAMQVSHKPFAMSVIMASSLGFAIPFGYACHLMVMGPGGYTLAHFVKIGVPLDIIVWMICSWLIPIFWPF